MQFARPQAALQLELKEKFPASSSDIDAFFAALAEAEHVGRALFTQRAMPSLLAKVHGLWHERDIRKWWGRSSAEVLNQLVSDPKLRAVLLAQKGNYGGTAANEMSFGVHAIIMRHYFNGGYYPVGGAQAFAEALVPAMSRPAARSGLGRRSGSSWSRTQRLSAFGWRMKRSSVPHAFSPMQVHAIP